MASQTLRLKINQELLKRAKKIDTFKWRLGDWDIKIKATKGWSVFNTKTGSSNVALFFELYGEQL